MREINVTGLQCTQAVMAVLREVVSMEVEEEMHITYEEPNARRDILAMVKRRKQIIDYNQINMEKNIDALVEARLPTKFGNFKLIAFPGDSKDKEDLA